MGDILIKTLLKIIDKEMEYYKDKKNDSWGNDKNNGFKLGLQYYRELLKNIERSIN